MAIVTRVLASTALAVFLAGGVSRAQQPSPPPQEHMHHHGEIQPVLPVYPRMGRAQERAAGKLFTLEEAERLAGDSNPTLRQAQAEIRAARSRQKQAGLYPNPTLGYTGDEIRGGSINGGGGANNEGAHTASSRHPGGVNVLMGDGTVKFVKGSISPQTWWALGTKANGEVVSADADRELVLVKGAVPGARGSVVVLRDSVKAPKTAGRS